MTGGRSVLRAPRTSGPFVWMGFFSLVLWARVENTWVLAAAAVFVGLSAWRAWGNLRHAISTVLLAVGAGVGLHTDLVSRQLTGDWESYWEQRKEEVAERLGGELDQLVALGDSSVERLARAAGLVAGGAR